MGFDYAIKENSGSVGASFTQRLRRALLPCGSIEDTRLSECWPLSAMGLIKTAASQSS